MLLTAATLTFFQDADLPHNIYSNRMLWRQKYQEVSLIYDCTTTA